MNVRQLIKRLVVLDPELLVVQAKDAEGNSFSPVLVESLEVYDAETKWSGEILDPEDYDGSLPNAVVLWPVN